MTFVEVCQECISNKDFVREFNRLSGHGLGVKRTPLDAAIDDACGHDPDKEALPDFIAFVHECIWEPLAKRK